MPIELSYIDILLYDNYIMSSCDLIILHPHIRERAMEHEITAVPAMLPG
ncbi:2-amino-4-hydroxy-6-hydroxymethyldihydropteridine diphosphokinase [Dehalococcoidia bacterium]|nr:2-amino-4-hydroxy-6-hydroxymethyldihydropteridine diphosphokinase [Dehalococcoidia bacterium]